MSIKYGNNVISIKLKTDKNISLKNSEIDQKKLIIKENINNLMNMLSRILKNDKINEISYEKIYTLAYKICNEKANKDLYDNLSNVFYNHIFKIYEETEKYFLEFEEMSEFIYRMIETYKDFSYRIIIIQKTLLYYEKNFLQKQITLEENLKLLANNIFYKIFINEKTNYKITEYIIFVLNKARQNEYIDKLLLRSLIGFFIEIKPQESAYKELLESHIIDSSILFYQINFHDKHFNKKLYFENKNLSFTFISNYFKEFYKILVNEEIRYIDSNLLISRNELLDNILEAVLLNTIEKEDIFFEFLIYIINQPNKETINTIRNCLDFSSTYSYNHKSMEMINPNLIINKNNNFIEKTINPKIENDKKKIKKIKDLLYLKLASALETVGRNFLEEEKILFLEKKNNNSPNYNKNSNSHLESVISIIEKLIKLIENMEIIKQESNIFNDKQYSQLIQNKLSVIVNNKFSNVKNNEKEMNLNNFLLCMSKNLAIHIDYTLKNFSNKLSYDDILNYFDKIILIFRLLDDKDVFEINNRKFLCQRILSQSYNEDLELKLISKLKLENGTIFTFRSEIMINDIQNSVNISDNYRNSKYYHKFNRELDKYKNIEINFKILTQGSWLINQDENIQSKDLISLCNLNKRFGFLNIFGKFDEFYKVFFPNKLLNLNLSYSTCELYSKFNGKNYIFTVSPLQGLILLCFNFIKKNCDNNKLDRNLDINLNNNTNINKETNLGTKNSNIISLIDIFLCMNKANRNTFLNSLIPLIKIGLINLILVRENNINNNVNHNNTIIDKCGNNMASLSLSNEDKINNNNKYSLWKFNFKESKISLYELLNNYFDLEINRNLIESKIKENNTNINKIRNIIYNNLNTSREFLDITSMTEFAFLNIKDISLEINLKFQTKHQKIRINYLREKEKKNSLGENISNKDTLDEENNSLKVERKYQIESNIIRILKGKKYISHQDLINQTLTALSNYFVPSISMIKLKIENLIERGFISRDKSDYNKYIYEV